MLLISIQKNQNLFDNHVVCLWKNTVTKRKEHSGTIEAEDYNQLSEILKRTILRQAAISIGFITSERRHIYKNVFRPDTFFLAKIQQSCLERCDIADSVAKKIITQNLQTAKESILNLCAKELWQLIPGPDKKKHEDIKQKVEQIKTFFSGSLGSLEPTELEKTSKIG